MGCYPASGMAIGMPSGLGPNRSFQRNISKHSSRSMFWCRPHVDCKKRGRGPPCISLTLETHNDIEVGCGSFHFNGMQDLAAMLR